MSNLGFIERYVPYPLRAAKLSLDLTLFPWWKPRFHYNRSLNEIAKEQGMTICSRTLESRRDLLSKVRKSTDVTRY